MNGFKGGPVTDSGYVGNSEQGQDWCQIHERQQDFQLTVNEIFDWGADSGIRSGASDVAVKLVEVRE